MLRNGNKNFDNILIEKAVYLIHLLMSYDVLDDEKQIIQILTNGISKALLSNNSDAFLKHLDAPLFHTVLKLKDTECGVTSGFFEQKDVKVLVEKYKM